MDTIRLYILEKIQKELHNCQAKLKKILEKLNEKIYTRYEVSREYNPTIYNIEVIAPNSINEDDYGIGIEVLIENSLTDIKCQISVIKSNGPFYLDKTFEIKVNEDTMDSDALTKSIEHIQSLPELVAKIYMKDYAYQKGERLN